MKRLLLGSLMSCLLVGQASAGFGAAIGGGLFTAGCGALGYMLGEKLVPSHSKAAALCGAAAGLLVSGWATWKLSKFSLSSCAQPAGAADASDDAAWATFIEDIQKGQAAAAAVATLAYVNSLLAQGYAKAEIVQNFNASLDSAAHMAR